MIFLFFSKKVDLFLRTQKFHMIFQHCGKKNQAKIWLPGGQKSHFFKINKGSRFGLLRFGSVLKSRKRFGRFEVRFTRGSGGSRFGIFRFDPTLLHIIVILIYHFLSLVATEKKMFEIYQFLVGIFQSKIEIRLSMSHKSVKMAKQWN